MIIASAASSLFHQIWLCLTSSNATYCVNYTPSLLLTLGRLYQWFIVSEVLALGWAQQCLVYAPWCNMWRPEQSVCSQDRKSGVFLYILSYCLETASHWTGTLAVWTSWLGQWTLRISPSPNVVGLQVHGAMLGLCGYWESSRVLRLEKQVLAHWIISSAQVKWILSH